MKKTLCALIVASCAAVSGCMSDEQIALSQSVIEALPDSINGCIFLGNVDSSARITLSDARYDLKYAAAMLGATHVVETHVYTAQLGISRDYGPALSGRAYKCQKGQGPASTDPKALLQYEYITVPFDDPGFF